MELLYDNKYDVFMHCSVRVKIDDLLKWERIVLQYRFMSSLAYQTIQFDVSLAVLHVFLFRSTTIDVDTGFENPFSEW